MGRTVKKLSGLEIDEVSLVDRPANQHGLVAIAKRQEDDMGEIFDAQGNSVDEGELEHGDVVYDGDGTEFVFVEGETAEQDDDNDDEGDEVGKAFWNQGGGGTAGKHIRHGLAQSRLGAKKLKESDTGQHLKRNKHRYGYGAATAGAGGAGYSVGKGASLGDAVLSELSKALTDSDRDEVIAKAMGTIEAVAKANEDLRDEVASLRAERDAESFVELAKGYELPGDPEGIGGLMYRASQALAPEDVQALDRFFTATGEIAKGAVFADQAGYDGYAESDILSQVYAAAGDVVSKADTGLTQEAAVTAIFTANPAAYDEYEAEQRFQR